MNEKLKNIGRSVVLATAMATAGLTSCVTIGQAEEYAAWRAAGNQGSYSDWNLFQEKERYNTAVKEGFKGSFERWRDLEKEKAKGFDSTDSHYRSPAVQDRY
jgi:hypothetical protein